jgi:catechol 2,3-dioxygenase-like lactoylglutathione lyase family enzyme
MPHAGSTAMASAGPLCLMSPTRLFSTSLPPGLVLGLFASDKFNQDLGTGEDRSAISGVTLSQNVASQDEVRAVVETMTAAGSSILKAPQAGEFGGIFHAHVKDPNGIIWEIAHNPSWSVDGTGAVSLS